MRSRRHIIGPIGLCMAILAALGGFSPAGAQSEIASATYVLQDADLGDAMEDAAILGATWEVAAYSVPTLPTETATGGTHAFWQGRDTTLPMAVPDLTVVSTTSGALTLQWTASGDDGSVGAAATYDIRYTSSGAITTQTAWNTATQASGEPTPQTAGNVESFMIGGLLPDTTYYLQIAVADETPNTRLSLAGGTNGLTRPQAASNLASVTSSGQASVSWDPVPGAIGYYVYYGTSSGNYSGTGAGGGPSPIDVGSVNSFTLTGLTNGTTYFVMVTAYNALGLESDVSSELPLTPLPSPTVDFARNIWGGTSELSYRMVSFPVQPSDPDPIANLSDDLGAYDITRWRMYAFDPLTSAYLEVSNAGAPGMAPGRGFWLISRYDADLDVSGALVNSGDDFDISLPPGWSLVGSPFDFPVGWDDCRADGIPILDPGQTSLAPELWDYAGGYVTATVFVTGRGYWVKNVSTSAVVLTLPPIVSTKPATFRGMTFEAGISGKPGGSWAVDQDGNVHWISSGPPPALPGGLGATAGSSTTSTPVTPSPSPTASAPSTSGAGNPSASSGGGGGGGGGCAVETPGADPGLSILLVLGGCILVGLRRARAGGSA